MFSRQMLNFNSLTVSSSATIAKGLEVSVTKQHNSASVAMGSKATTVDYSPVRCHLSYSSIHSGIAT